MTLLVLVVAVYQCVYYVSTDIVITNVYTCMMLKHVEHKRSGTGTGTEVEFIKNPKSK